MDKSSFRPILIIMIFMLGFSTNAKAESLLGGMMMQEHVEVWAAPESSTFGKFLYQIGTDLRYEKRIVVSYNLFLDFKNRHYNIDLYEELINAYQEEKLPDIAIMPFNIAASLIGILPMSIVPEEYMPKSIRPELKRAVSHQGKYYGIPFHDGNHMMLYYNKQYVQKPPNSWAELINDSVSAESQGVAPIVWPLNKTRWMCAIVDCASAVNEDASELFPEQLNQYRRVVEQSVVDNECAQQCSDWGCEYECVINKFYGGKAAFMINGDWATAEAQKFLGDDVGITSVPRPDDSKNNMKRFPTAMVFFNDAFRIGKRQTIEKTIKHFTSKSVQKWLFFQTGKIPARKSSYDNIVKKVNRKQLDFISLEIMDDWPLYSMEDNETVVYGTAFDEILTMYIEHLQDDEQEIHKMYSERLVFPQKLIPAAE